LNSRFVGMKQVDHHYPCPKVVLKFDVKGKSRGPFGWDMLRELAASAPGTAPGPQGAVR